LADRVTIIRKGRRIQTGTLADLRRHTRTSVHAVTVQEPAALASAAGVADFKSKRLDGIVDSRFTIDPDHLDEVVGRLHSAHIHTLTVTPPSLDTLFLRSYGDDIEQLETAAANAEESVAARQQR
ncbi:MAG: ABC transporter ATP-binding protein, partial [Acidimicrobiia bacterium]